MRPFRETVKVKWNITEPAHVLSVTVLPVYNAGTILYLFPILNVCFDMYCETTAESTGI